MLRVARRGALKAQWRPPNSSTGCSTAPLKSFASRCSGSRPRPWSGSVRPCGPGPSPAPPRPPRPRLRVLARRWQQLQAELTQLDAQLQELVAAVAPALVALPRVGVDTAGRCWSPPAIIPSGSAPRPPSPLCGTPRSRRPRAAPTATGSTGAGTARPTTPCGGSPWSACAATPPTRAYVQRQTKQGLSKPDILRCLVGLSRSRLEGRAVASR